jgi:hypothetical protein
LYEELLFQAAVANFFIVEINGIFERFERKIKTIRILRLETDEKVHLREGAGAEDNLANDKGGPFHNPAQAGYEKNGKGAQIRYAKMHPCLFCIQRLHQQYPLSPNRKAGSAWDFVLIYDLKFCLDGFKPQILYFLGGLLLQPS